MPSRKTEIPLIKVLHDRDKAATLSLEKNVREVAGIDEPPLIESNYMPSASELTALHNGLVLLLQRLRTQKEIQFTLGDIDPDLAALGTSPNSSGEEAFIRHLVDHLPRSLRMKMTTNPDDKFDRKAKVSIGSMIAFIASFIAIYAGGANEDQGALYAGIAGATLACLTLLYAQTEHFQKVAEKSKQSSKVPPEAETFYRVAKKVYSLEQTANALEKIKSPKASAAKKAVEDGKKALQELAIQLNHNLISDSSDDGPTLAEDLMSMGVGDKVRIAIDEMEEANMAVDAYKSLDPEEMEAQALAEFDEALAQTDKEDRIKKL